MLQGKYDLKKKDHLKKLVEEATGVSQCFFATFR